MLYTTLNILLLLSATFASQFLSHDNVGMSEFALNGAYDRPLRAAKRSHEIGKRDVKGCLSHGHHLHYVDGEDAHTFLISLTNRVLSKHSCIESSIRRQSRR